MTAYLYLRICLDFIQTALLENDSPPHTEELYQAHRQAWAYIQSPNSPWTRQHTKPHYPPGGGLISLLQARDFLAPYAPHRPPAHEQAFLQALAQYDPKLPRAFALYRDMRLDDMGAIRPMTPGQLAELRAYTGFETILTEDWADDTGFFERVPIQKIILKTLDFLETYVRPYSKSHQMLFDYPAATRAFFQGGLPSAELAQQYGRQAAYQRKKFKNTPHLYRQEAAMGFFLWEAAWNEGLAEQEGVQDPPFFYFWDTLAAINAGLSLQWRDFVSSLLPPPQTS
ncbi:MAG: hypothetical protein Q3966_09530 [Neisseria sp.]|nr:hypothetical protein [Neisseria sp.]